MFPRIDSTPGTYVLVLTLSVPAELQIGSLGLLHFDAPFYLYFGSAFGPGGLGARVKHHLNPVRRAHWHIDYLRQVAEVVDVWYTTDQTRLECTWVGTAMQQPGISPVPRFGSSDCRCEAHLLAAHDRPSLREFRSRLNSDRGGSAVRWYEERQ